MKSLKLFMTALFAMALSISVMALSQTKTGTNTGALKTETLKVWGNCEMCKARIEKAVKDEGALTADWNIKTKILTVSFDPAKTNVNTFSKRLAAAGHDTEKHKADDKAYEALASCCKYTREK